MKHFNFMVLIYVLFAGNSILTAKSGNTESPNGVKNQDILVKRKVLILNFVNTQKSPDFGYLEETIPDAFLDPLGKTKSFELLPRSEWKKLTDTGKFKQNDAAREDIAVDAGKSVDADVVVIGSYAALSDRIQIFSKAIELPSGRVMISLNKSAPLDNYMFDSINTLANEMSSEMRDKLPPMEQKVVTQERIIDTAIVRTHGGMIWRTLTIPGWGHTYAHQWRGWLYTGLWVGGLSANTYFWINYFNSKSAYEKDPSEKNYQTYGSASIMRGYGLIGILSVYTLSFADILIFGNKYVVLTEKRLPRFNLAFASPAILNVSGKNSSQVHFNFDPGMCLVIKYEF